MTEDFEFAPDPLVGAGEWANETRVSRGREALVIDFIVLDPVEPRGTIVSRINLAPGAALELREALIEELDDYTDVRRPEPE